MTDLSQPVKSWLPKMPRLSAGLANAARLEIKMKTAVTALTLISMVVGMIVGGLRVVASFTRAYDQIGSTTSAMITLNRDAERRQLRDSLMLTELQGIRSDIKLLDSRLLRVERRVR